MAGKRAVVPVHVHLPDGGVAVYAAGDEIPAAHQKLISNPNVWKAEDPEFEPEGAEKTGDES